MSWDVKNSKCSWLNPNMADWPQSLADPSVAGWSKSCPSLEPNLPRSHLGDHFKIFSSLCLLVWTKNALRRAVWNHRGQSSFFYMYFCFYGHFPTSVGQGRNDEHWLLDSCSVVWANTVSHWGSVVGEEALDSNLKAIVLVSCSKQPFKACCWMKEGWTNEGMPARPGHFTKHEANLSNFRNQG